MGRATVKGLPPASRLGWGRQSLLAGALWLLAVVFTVLVAPSSGAYFERFYGPVRPLVVMVGVGVVGGAAFWVLSRFGFVIVEGRRTLAGLRLAAIFATVLAIAVVVADVLLRYPEDLNVPVPRALLFYPAIGLTAEVAFHLVPLAVLLPVLNAVVPRVGRERVAWFALAVVAVAEPVFQVLVGGGGTGSLDVYTWVHVLLFASLQLYVFRRFDFASMYGFRLVYYVYWHILWGTIRIPVLF